MSLSWNWKNAGLGKFEGDRRFASMITRKEVVNNLDSYQKCLEYPLSVCNGECSSLYTKALYDYSVIQWKRISK